MNKTQKVLVGAALVLSLAGLLVGLSNTGNIASLAQNAGNAVQQFGAIASKWTNFANSGVTTKVGYALTSSDNSTTTVVISPSGTYYGQIGGSASTTLSVNVSTTLANNFDCLYDTFVIAANAAPSITLTLPAATGTAATCLLADGTQDNTLFVNNSSNTVTFATSTGDVFFWNNSSTPSGNVIAGSSSLGAVGELLNAYRINSSTIYYVVTQVGVAH